MKFPVKALVICGPTATGKTALALKLAKRFNGELISADSRQIFQGLDIGTGKDKPKNITIYGYDLIAPNQTFSVAQYYAYVQQILPNIIARKKIPIIVGGTGFYLQALIKPFNTLSLPPNPGLRQQLAKLSLLELQNRLLRQNPDRWSKLNPSDQANPRRLIRALEVTTISTPTLPALIDPLIIGLTLPPKTLALKIKARVQKRATPAFTAEITRLTRTYPSLSQTAASAIGYQEWQRFMRGETTKAATLEIWTLHECQYARRQLTWFRKMPLIEWFDCGHPKFSQNIVARVNSWYHESYDP